MYDLHNHILPGIDDGSPDIETSIELAKLAVKDGITNIVCTPHIHNGVYNNSKTLIEQKTSDLQRELLKNNINLRVASGAEIRIDPIIMSLVKNGKAPFIGKLNGKNIILIEFPSNQIPIGSDNLIRWLHNNNVTTMIAHPERNSVFQNHPATINKFVQLGCLIQLTASSISGSFGAKARKTMADFLLSDVGDVIATDSHNLKYRPPVLSEGFRLVKELISEERAKFLFIENPKKIAESKFSIND